MGYPWATHGAYSRATHGLPIGYPRETHGLSMGDPWASHGMPMGYHLSLHWIRMELSATARYYGHPLRKWTLRKYQVQPNSFMGKRSFTNRLYLKLSLCDGARTELSFLIQPRPVLLLLVQYIARCPVCINGRCKPRITQ